MFAKSNTTRMDGQAILPEKDLRAMSWLRGDQNETTSFVRKGSGKWKTLTIVLLIGFLLGRAIMLLQLLPFTIPFLAVIFKWKRSLILPASFALIAGSASLSFTYAGHTTLAILVYFALQGFMLKVDSKERYLPLIVFLAVAITRYVGLAIANEPSLYHLLTATVEGALALVITLIFFQSVPLLFERRKHVTFKHEEVVCIVILLGSLLTGTVGWMIYQLSIEHMIARYIVLVFAFVGGATIGSTVGVIMGLILSLANVAHLFTISMLAFAGLLGGLLREGKKISVSAGLLVATLLMAMYADSQSSLSVTMYESLIAVGLFLFTPKIWTSRLASFIPGTVEYAQEQQQYLRKIRDLTAGKVEHFSELFLSLSRSFAFIEKNESQSEKEREVDLFLSGVTEKTCQMCMKKNQCWTKDFQKTYTYMEALTEECETHNGVQDKTLIADWRNHCLIDKRVIEVIQDQLKEQDTEKRLKRQLVESRRLVADQLIGVSQVMEDFARDIQCEKKAHDKQEEDVKQALIKSGIDVDLVEIYGLDPGNVDIEMILPSNKYNEAEKVVAPMLSNILNESIVVKQTEVLSSNRIETKVLLGSTKSFVVEQGIAHTAKGGMWVSGDSYSTMEIGEGKYAMAISDGMGNGKRANVESQETIELLKQILQSGIKETVAIKSINSILSLRSSDEVFATLDLAIIDLQEGVAKFLKVGSTPSYVKRGNKVLSIEAGNLPIGMIDEVEVDVVSEQLKAGDLLIMMSDGIYESPKRIENTDVWIKRVLREMETTDPQVVADLMIDRVIRESDGEIHDDMTILVAKIDHYVPKWATISIPAKNWA